MVVDIVSMCTQCNLANKHRCHGVAPTYYTWRCPIHETQFFFTDPPYGVMNANEFLEFTREHSET